MSTNQKVILVAFETDKTTSIEAQKLILSLLPKPSKTKGLESWWIAEGDRIDGSDCDSAEFVPYFKASNPNAGYEWWSLS